MTATVQETPVLLVEDNPADVLLFQRAYTRANILHPLQVVGDGQVAIEYLTGAGLYNDRARYPLPLMMLLDLKLPRRPGLEVLAWVRQHPTLKRLPVVVFTSSNQQIDIDRAYDLAVNSYLVKPPTSAALTELMRVIEQYWMRLNQLPTL